MKYLHFAPRTPSRLLAAMFSLMSLLLLSFVAIPAVQAQRSTPKEAQDLHPFVKYAPGTTLADGSNTAIEISKIRTLVHSARPSLPKLDTTSVLLASETSFADALAASGLLNKHVLLLTKPEELEPEVLAELQRLNAKRVVLIGGTKALTPTVEAQLQAANFEVSRIAGANREETALRIYQTFAETNPIIDARWPVYVSRAYGEGSSGFADAISLGALAARNNVPILLNGSDNVTPYMRDLDISVKRSLVNTNKVDITFIGGVQALPTAIDLGIRAGYPGWDVKRISGSNRFATAVALSQAGEEPDGLIVVDGSSDNAWQAGFVVPSLAYQTNSAVLLTNGDTIPVETKAVLNQFGIKGRPAGSLFCFASTVACDEVETILDQSPKVVAVEPRVCSPKTIQQHYEENLHIFKALQPRVTWPREIFGTGEDYDPCADLSVVRFKAHEYHHGWSVHDFMVFHRGELVKTFNAQIFRPVIIHETDNKVAIIFGDYLGTSSEENDPIQYAGILTWNRDTGTLEQSGLFPSETTHNHMVHLHQKNYDETWGTFQPVPGAFPGAGSPMPVSRGVEYAGNYFKTPSGNIGCERDRCIILSRNNLTHHDIQEDDQFLVDTINDFRIFTETDWPKVWLDGTDDVLPYGKMTFMSGGNVVCGSQKTGLTCWSPRTGKGVHMNRAQGYVPFAVNRAGMFPTYVDVYKRAERPELWTFDWTRDPNLFNWAAFYTMEEFWFEHSRMAPWDKVYDLDYE